MPSRSYLQPTDFSHLEVLLREAGFKPAEGFVRAPLPSRGALALCVGVNPMLIERIIKKKDEHYRNFEIAKSGSGTRKISGPRTYLKVIQWWILDNVLLDIDIPDFVFGFRRNFSPYQNASFHLGSRYFLSVDIKDFFPSISKEDVANVFCGFGYPNNVVSLLSELCTYKDSLPQGAPTSPMLSNFAFLPIDHALSKLASSRGLRYSRYADDITFSSDIFIEESFVNEISDIVSGGGFLINERKTRFRGPGASTQVTGFVVRDGIRRPRKWRKKFRAMLHQARLKPETYVENLDQINGMVGALFDPSKLEQDPLVDKGKDVAQMLRVFGSIKAE